MPAGRLSALVTVLLIFVHGGCGTAQSPAVPAAAVTDRANGLERAVDLDVSVTSSTAMQTPLPGNGEAAPLRGDPSPLEQVVRLPGFEVRETRLTDFGMSIRTNAEVAKGGKIRWMRVGQVVTGSAAHKARLAPDNRILSINGKSVAELARTAMLDTFFARSREDRVTLVVLDGRAYPRVVVLAANARGLAR